MCGPSLAVASGGYSLVVVHGLITEVASLVAAQALGSMGFHSCSSGAPERRLMSCFARAYLL